MEGAELDSGNRRDGNNNSICWTSIHSTRRTEQRVCIDARLLAMLNANLR